MSLKIKVIPVQFVAQAWPLVEKYIVDAIEYGGDDYTLDQIKDTQGQDNKGRSTLRRKHRDR